jgi:putative acetyltransferase
MNILIRKEVESDIEAISAITRAAFEDNPHSQGTEEFIIHALRNANALAISLIAEAEKKVVGHIAFSRVTISDGTPDWYGLGPISVLPVLQRQGIGRSLMQEGLSSLKARGAKGCVLVGDPGYYEQFGFRSFPDLVVDGVPQPNVLALPFGTDRARGTVAFHEGFSAKS